MRTFRKIQAKFIAGITQIKTGAKRLCVPGLG